MALAHDAGQHREHGDLRGVVNEGDIKGMRFVVLSALLLAQYAERHHGRGDVSARELRCALHHCTVGRHIGSIKGHRVHRLRPRTHQLC